MRFIALAASFLVGFALVAGLSAMAVRLAAPRPAIAAGDPSGAPDAPAPTPTPAQANNQPMINAHVFNKAGTLVGPVAMSKVVKTDAEWKALLTPEQYQIARAKGTERPFCGTLLDNKTEGVYSCICCALPLFASNSKFDSGTGWPSFFQPIAKENVAQRLDDSHFQLATEILCARCDAHLGHVFDDGPRPTGLRFCLNSESLTFTDAKRLATLADPAAERITAPSAAPASKPVRAANPGRAEAVFAGGCFWCVEAVFEELEGVIEAVSGYAGGDAAKANYRAVSVGDTGHAEAVKIIYDPSKIDFETLLRVHLATHDPTTLNRQGNDIGPQYRSVIFFRSDAEKQAAERVIAELNASGVYRRPIVTTVEPLDAFHEAEPYHQNYVCQNPTAGYVQGVSMPKVEKVREKFKDRLKAKSPLEK